MPTDRFYNSYDQEKDKRFKHTYWSSTAEIPDEFDAIVPKDEKGNPQHISFYRPHIKKFREKMPNDNSQGSGLDHSIIRYADVLLMYAEVLNELGNSKCYEYINMVRERAGLEPLQTMSKDAFREHLMLERAWELCFEGDPGSSICFVGAFIVPVRRNGTRKLKEIFRKESMSSGLFLNHNEILMQI